MLIFFFWVIYRRNFMPMQITAHAIGIAMCFALSEWSELRLSWAVWELFCCCCCCFFGGFFFLKSEKKMCRSPPPPPPPPLNLLPFFLFFLAFVPFLGWPWCLLLSQSALRSLKCPFWKWPCPSKSLIRALHQYQIFCIPDCLLIHLNIIIQHRHQTSTTFLIESPQC